MSFKLSFKNIGLFTFIWLNVGIALGFIVLIGPVRWVANYARNHNYSDNSESTLVKVVMLLFVVFSFVISSLLTSNAVKARSRNTKFLIPTICVLLGGFALFQLLNPQYLKNFSSQERDIENKQFIFGSYPSLDELKQFKKEGFSSVISLLHPAVTPFEPVLLKEEEENCKKAGLTLISIPMLPWISENGEALNKVKQLAQNPTGKYYVHCYLGKDRVNLVKRLISTYNQSVKLEVSESKGRSLSAIEKFERGPITKISNDVYYIPYPTDEEYTSYVIGGGVQQVISLMDSTDIEQKPRIDAEKVLLDTYHIPFYSYPIAGGDKKQLLAKLREKILLMPKPLVIHRFFSDTSDDLEIIEELKK